MWSLPGLGGFARFLVGVYLIYFLGVLQAVYVELEGAALDVRHYAHNVDYVGERLNMAVSNIVYSLESSLALLAVIALVWVIGGILLASGWDRLRSRWPSRINLLYSLAVFATYAILALAILYPAVKAFGLLERVGSLEPVDVLRPLGETLIVPYAYALPLALPLLRSLLAVRYSGVGRIAGALLVLGSILYLLGAYNVYMAIRPFTVIREHWAELVSKGLTEEGLVELSVVTLETSQLMVLRVTELVKVLALASLIYSLAFITMSRRVQEVFEGVARTLREHLRLPTAKAPSTSHIPTLG